VADVPSEDAERSRAEDEALVLRIQNGDSSAEEEIAKKYRRKLHYFLYRWIKDWDAAEGLCHESLADVLLAARESRIRSGQAFSSYLHQVAKHKAFDWIHKRAREPIGDPETLDRERRRSQETGGQQDPFEHALERQVAERAFRGLSVQAQRAILMRLRDGREYAEIARALGVSETYARQIVSRARRKLREAIWGHDS
jgi:RNA polymerase sigma-70 factor (ECF subfamily)